MRTVLDRSERRKRELIETWQTRYDNLEADFELAKQVGGAAAILAGCTVLGLVQSRRSGLRALRDANAQLLRVGAQKNDMERALVRDVNASHQKGVTALSKDLFGVIDTLEMAADAASRDAETPAAIAEGVGMVHGSFLKVLEAHGVRPITAHVGDTFDPTRHHAEKRLPLQEGTKHNTLASVHAPGYEFVSAVEEVKGDTVLLRACKVDVFIDDSVQ